jgi:hypothetical protein
MRSTRVLFVARVVTTTDVDFDPAGTITVAGTCVPEPSVVISIFKPPTGAGPVNESSNRDAVPPSTEFGVRTAVDIDGRFTMSFACNDSVSFRADRKASTSVPTGTVVTFTVTSDFPSGTFTKAGT